MLPEQQPEYCMGCQVLITRQKIGASAASGADILTSPSLLCFKLRKGSAAECSKPRKEKPFLLLYSVADAQEADEPLHLIFLSRNICPGSPHPRIVIHVGDTVST